MTCLVNLISKDTHLASSISLHITVGNINTTGSFLFYVSCMPMLLKTVKPILLAGKYLLQVLMLSEIALYK